MSAMFNSIALSVTAHPDRPIYDGSFSVREFFRRYRMWCLRVSWTDAARVTNLPYCVAENYRARVESHVFSGDTVPEYSSVVTWFIKEFSMGESPRDYIKDLEEKLRHLKMKQKQSIREFHLQYTESVRVVNDARREFNEYRQPELPSGLNADGSVPEGSSVSQTISSDYKRAKAKWNTMKEKFIEEPELTKKFLEKLTPRMYAVAGNDLDFDGADTEFPNIQAVVTSLIKWSRYNNVGDDSRKRKRTPTKQVHFADTDTKQQMAQSYSEPPRHKTPDSHDQIQQLEIEKDRLEFQLKEARLNFASIAQSYSAAGSGQPQGHFMHPDRQRLNKTMRQSRGGSPSVSPPPASYSSGNQQSNTRGVTCYACGEAHFVKDCPYCRCCGRKHPGECKFRQTSWCNWCDRAGHVTTSCRKRKGNALPHGWIRHDPHPSRVCQDWANRGSCPRGEDCFRAHRHPKKQKSPQRRQQKPQMQRKPMQQQQYQQRTPMQQQQYQQRTPMQQQQYQQQTPMQQQYQQQQAPMQQQYQQQQTPMQQQTPIQQQAPMQQQYQQQAQQSAYIQQQYQSPAVQSPQPPVIQQQYQSPRAPAVQSPQPPAYERRFDRLEQAINKSVQGINILAKNQKQWSEQYETLKQTQNGMLESLQSQGNCSKEEATDALESGISLLSQSLALVPAKEHE